jgi:tripartite-type tricarboxylate transporter receptor subunit TctC
MSISPRKQQGPQGVDEADHRPQRHRRSFVKQLPRDGREHELRRGGDDADADVAGDPRSDTGDLSLRILDIEAHALSPLEQHRAGRRQADAAPGLLEQGGAAVFLQTPHATGEGRLRPMQLRRGTAHVLESGDGFEVAEVTEVHSKSPHLWIVRNYRLDRSLRSANTERHRDARTKASTVNRRQPVQTARRLLLALVATTLTTSALAQAWPSKPIRVLVPFPPGGGTDIVAREVTQAVTTNTKWTFVIDNKPGAGGNLGVDQAAKSSPDGYTIVLGQTSNLAINPTLYSKLPYDPVKDLVPIGLVASAPLVHRRAGSVAVQDAGRPRRGGEGRNPARSTSRRRAMARSRTSPARSSRRPRASASSTYRTRARTRRSPTSSAAKVQLYVSSVPSVLQQIRTGKLRPLAVTSEKRVDDLPQTPTVGEAGYKGFDAITWFGFLAPAGTPKDVVAKLNAEFNKALQQPDLKKRLGDEGADPLGGTPEQFAQVIRDDITRWGKIVKESGVKLD